MCGDVVANSRTFVAIEAAGETVSFVDLATFDALFMPDGGDCSGCDNCGCSPCICGAKSTPKLVEYVDSLTVSGPVAPAADHFQKLANENKRKPKSIKPVKSPAGRESQPTEKPTGKLWEAVQAVLVKQPLSSAGVFQALQRQDKNLKIASVYTELSKRKLEGTLEVFRCETDGLNKYRLVKPS